MNFNKVILAGNLTKDVELKKTNSGKSIAQFSIAYNKSYKQGDEWKKETHYFNVIAWGTLGENCAKYLAKGRTALVEGELSTRSYEAKDGTKKTLTEVNALKVEFGNQPKESPKQQEPEDNGYVPF